MRRIVSFACQRQPRTVEPHACGVVAPDGKPVLRGRPVAGSRASALVPGWRTLAISAIGELAVAEATFDAPRAGYSPGRPRPEPVRAELGPDAAP